MKAPYGKKWAEETPFNMTTPKSRYNLIHHYLTALVASSQKMEADRIEHEHIGDCHIKSFNGPNCMEGGIGFFCGNGRTIIIIEFQMASSSSTAVSSFDRKSRLRLWVARKREFLVSRFFSISRLLHIGKFEFKKCIF